MTSWSEPTDSADHGLTPGSDSIQIVAFFATCSIAGTDPIRVKHSVVDVSGGGDVLNEGSVDIPSEGGELPVVRNRLRVQRDS